MKTNQGSVATTVGSQPTNGRTIWISTAVFATCLALYIAEQHRFRIFGENMLNIQTATTAVPSPLEIGILLAITSLGVCAGLATLIALIGRIIQRLQRTQYATGKDGKSQAPRQTVPSSGVRRSREGFSPAERNGEAAKPAPASQANGV